MSAPRPYATASHKSRAGCDGNGRKEPRCIKFLSRYQRCTDTATALTLHRDGSDLSALRRLRLSKSEAATARQQSKLQADGALGKTGVGDSARAKAESRKSRPETALNQSHARANPNRI